MGVGLPIKIDPLTISLYHGLYTRILVEVDLSKTLTRRVIATKKDLHSCNKMEFFVDIYFDNVPKFCDQCKIIGHDDACCNRKSQHINQ